MTLKLKREVVVPDPPDALLAPHPESTPWWIAPLALLATISTLVLWGMCLWSFVDWIVPSQ